VNARTIPATAVMSVSIIGTAAERTVWTTRKATPGRRPIVPPRAGHRLAGISWSRVSRALDSRCRSAVGGLGGFVARFSAYSDVVVCSDTAGAVRSNARAEMGGEFIGKLGATDCLQRPHG
jgi:hypothetical protein